MATFSTYLWSLYDEPTPVYIQSCITKNPYFEVSRFLKAPAAPPRGFQIFFAVVDRIEVKPYFYEATVDFDIKKIHFEVFSCRNIYSDVRSARYDAISVGTARRLTAAISAEDSKFKEKLNF